MNNQTQDKKYVCASCGSVASGTAGDCCGAERKEKKTDNKGGSCGCCCH